MYFLKNLSDYVVDCSVNQDIGVLRACVALMGNIFKN